MFVTDLNAPQAEVFIVVNLLTKFRFHTFSHSRDIEGVPTFKSRSLTAKVRVTAVLLSCHFGRNFYMYWEIVRG